MGTDFTGPEGGLREGRSFKGKQRKIKHTEASIISLGNPFTKR